MADTRGVFRLGTLKTENVQGVGVDNNDVWLPHADINLSNYGYYVSGTTDSGGTLKSTVDRTNMSTDTTQSLPSSQIPESSHDGVALGSLTHLYASGGWAVGTKVFKMSYSDETWATGTSMARNTRSMGDNGVGSKLDGYVIMGDDTGYPGPENSTVQKLTYASDTWAQGIGFPYISTWSMGASNDNIAIIAGGDTSNGGSESSKTYKLTFANDSYTQMPANMIPNASGPGNGNRAEASASGNATHMYVSAGRMPSGMSNTTIKYTYADDTWDRMPGANSSRTRRWNQAYGNTTQGYSAGGNSPSPNYSTVDKINYSNDTSAYTPSANLTISRLKGMVASPRQNGWGASTSPGVAPYRWRDNATTGTGHAVEFNGSNQRLDIADTTDLEIGSSQFTMECWFYQHTDSGGGSGSHTLLSKWDNDGRKEFIWRVSNPGTQKLHWLSSSNGSSNDCDFYGSTTISNNTWHHAAVTRDSGGTIRMFLNGILQSATGSQSSTHANTHEFMIAANGSSGIEQYMDGAISNVRFIKGQCLWTSSFTAPTLDVTTTSQGAIASNVKLICCNETTVTGSIVTPGTITAINSPTVIAQTVIGIGAPPSTPTPNPSPMLVPNLSNDGYNIGGRWNTHPSYGSVSQSWVMKINYSTETPSLDTNTLAGGRNQFATFSSGTAGYVLGGSYEGWPSSYPSSTRIQKLTYSSSTTAWVPGQNLSENLHRGSGVSNPVYGYAAGGLPGIRSNIQKYTFTTDTISSNLPAKINNFPGTGVFDMGSAGNVTHGFFMGGDAPGSPGYSQRATKIEYNTDTVNTLDPAFYDLAGSRNFAATGYKDVAAYLSASEGPGSGGGQHRSLLTKLTYSTDIITAVPSSNFSTTNGSWAAHGDWEKAYFAGGGHGTLVNRLTYSTETISFSPSNTWNFPSSVPGSGGPGAYQAIQGGAFSAKNNNGGKVPTAVNF
jgi:hypothetical protein